MGADIYLNSRYEANQAKWQPAFDAAVAVRNAKYPQGVQMPDDCPEQRAVSEAFQNMYSVGYFRDSYNATRLFGVLDLSWWDNDFIRKDGKMGARGMKKLRAKLDAFGEITEAKLGPWAKAQEHVNFKAEGNALSDWATMFERKRTNLIALIDEALALGEPLDCSV